VSKSTVQGYGASRQARPVDIKDSGDGVWDRLGGGASKRARLVDVKLGTRVWWNVDYGRTTLLK
jgi:hypothetical protein